MKGINEKEIQMSDLIRRSDVVNEFKYKYPYIVEELDEIPAVNALELNEDLMIKLNQLGYVKVLRCKKCCDRDTIGCPMYSPVTERSMTIDNGFCHLGNLEE